LRDIRSRLLQCQFADEADEIQIAVTEMDPESVGDAARGRHLIRTRDSALQGQCVFQEGCLERKGHDGTGWRRDICRDERPVKRQVQDDSLAADFPERALAGKARRNARRMPAILCYTAFDADIQASSIKY
jgi:hypothetical protein